VVDASRLLELGADLVELLRNDACGGERRDELDLVLAMVEHFDLADRIARRF
jgi:hypothetical protein